MTSDFLHFYFCHMSDVILISSSYFTAFDSNESCLLYRLVQPIIKISLLNIFNSSPVIFFLSINILNDIKITRNLPIMTKK